MSYHTLSGYLVVRQKERGYQALSARFVEKTPALGKDEISIKIEANIPSEFFTRPQLVFKINVPEEAMPQQVVTAEVSGNIEDIIKQNLGINVTLIAQPNSE